MNLLIINTHDTGVFNSVYGVENTTPNLKEFASDSTVFDNAFCASPTCSPSRGAMLTGEYPTQNGLIGLAHRGFSIADKSKHLACHLAKCGFETALSGIQHENVFWFDPRPAMALGYQKIITDYEFRGTTVDDYMTWDRHNAIRAGEYLKSRNKDTPFFLSYGTFSTHRGYPTAVDVENADVALPNGMASNAENVEDTTKLYQSLKYFDDSFKIVIDALKESGEYDNTLIIVTTDHGLANPFEKCNLECGGSNVMMMVRSPKEKAMRGKRSAALISHVDVYPTVCEILGVEQPAWLCGKSFADCLCGDAEINPYIFGELNFHTSYEPARCVRSKDYVYIEYLHNFDNYNLSNIDESPCKDQLIADGTLAKKKSMCRLYDKKIDKLEKTNLAGDARYAEIESEYREILHGWMKDKCDKVLTPADYLKSYQVNKMTCRYPSLKDEGDREV